MKPEDRKRVSSGLKSWLDDVSAYEKQFQKWESRSEKIVKRYRDDQTTAKDGYGQSRFNILWSNVQTLKAATFSKLPKADVSRRFKDQDPVGRVASLILERALDYEISHYPDYRATLDADVLDRFLGGRGTAWVRYEPHMRAVDTLTDGAQVTDDIDEGEEELDYECAPTDYVHWRDFGHTVARTWEEVPRVWRRVYMRRDALIERFGEKLGKAIPLDSVPEELKKQGLHRETDTACIYEGWDKKEKKAVWFSKSIKDFLDERDDPLGLKDFFPCPKPLYSTLANDNLEPTPDYALYQDQALELDVLCDRIDGLIKALKVAGCYDASIPALKRLFTEGENTTLVPVNTWNAFAEKNGLKGSIDIYDLTPIANALKEAYMAMEQVKSQVYDITGISDIIRGQSNAAETATAQQIKGQYASLRLKSYQEGVSLFATGLLQLKAQIICNKFDPQTIVMISGASQLSPSDQQLVGPALELLLGPRAQDPSATAPNPMRDFRIEVAADSLVYLDEEAEKTSRNEFLASTSQFLEKTVMALSQIPPEMAAIMTPLAMDLLKFGVQGFRIGKTIEGSFDEVAEKLKQMAAQPKQPQPDPAVIEAQAKAKEAQDKLQAHMQEVQVKAQADAFVNRQKQAAEEQKMQREMAMKEQEAMFNQRLDQQKAIWDKELEEFKAGIQLQLEDKKINAQNEQAKEKNLMDAERDAERQSVKAEEKPESNEDVKRLAESVMQAMEEVKQAAEIMKKPRKLVRGKDGRAIGSVIDG